MDFSKGGCMVLAGTQLEYNLAGTWYFLMKSIISSLGLPFLYIETFGRFCLLLPDVSFFGCAFFNEAWNLQYLSNAVSSFARGSVCCEIWQHRILRRESLFYGANMGEIVILCPSLFSEMLKFNPCENMSFWLHPKITYSFWFVALCLSDSLRYWFHTACLRASTSFIRHFHRYKVVLARIFSLCAIEDIRLLPRLRSLKPSNNIDLSHV